MTLVFWVILAAGTLGAVDGTIKMNNICKKEVEEGVSKDMKECKQYYFDTRIKKGWQWLALRVQEPVFMTHPVLTVSDVVVHPQRLRTGL